MNMIISHIRQDDDGRWMIQTNDEHQRGVAELAGKFAADFDMAAWGEVVGLLHDKGKEKRAFQEHIMRNSGYRPEVVVSGNKDHAVVGALIAKQLFPQFHLLMDNVLMGHHRGLYDEEECQQKLFQKLYNLGNLIPLMQL